MTQFKLATSEGDHKTQERLLVELRTELAEKAEAPFFDFLYRHPDGDEHTVTIFRSDVLEHMEEQLFEKLTGKLCHCEPVGETNVVDCNCDEVAEQFELVKAGEGGAQ